MRLDGLIAVGILLMVASCVPHDAGPPPLTERNEPHWIPLFDGKTLEGWFARGQARWEVRDGILTGIGGMGHIYAEPVLRDLDIKGTFRISDGGNSGLYFRCAPPAQDPNGFPEGYEAQIDNHGDAHTGWLWKPGTPTAKAARLATQDNEWFSLHVKAIGEHIQIWVNDELMTEHDDGDYQEGRFAIQAHNPGMTIKARDLFYRDLSGE